MTNTKRNAVKMVEKLARTANHPHATQEDRAAYWAAYVKLGEVELAEAKDDETRAAVAACVESRRGTLEALRV